MTAAAAAKISASVAAITADVPYIICIGNDRHIHRTNQLHLMSVGFNLQIKKIIAYILNYNGGTLHEQSLTYYIGTVEWRHNAMTYSDIQYD